MSSKSLIEKKFILPATAILVGAAMVWTGNLEGSQWAMMSTTLVTGFYAIEGWDSKHLGGSNDN
jgi:hypothetical protein